MGDQDPAMSAFFVPEHVPRKRASRACDQCRRRKSRCDGLNICDPCSSIGLQCSYGQRVKQTRGPAYIAHLEKKVANLEDQLKRMALASDGDFEDDVSSTRIDTELSPLEEHAALSPLSIESAQSSRLRHANGQSGWAALGQPPEEYLSTVTSEPQGRSFGIDVLRQLCNFCNQIIRPPGVLQDTPVKIIQALDRSQSIDATSASPSNNPYLPPKPDTMRLIDIAFTEPFQLWPFVDRAQIERTIYRLYHTNTFGQEQCDQDDLALVYAILALGQRFDTSSLTVASAQASQGVVYFVAAKEMMPLATCDRGLVGVQTILCLALFLKAAGALTRVHAYVAGAASAALRLGLHEGIPGFSEDEAALRRRVWSTVQVLDVYISTSLGVPATATIGCEWQDAFPPMNTGSNAELVASGAHLDLLRTFSKAIAITFPAKRSTVTGNFVVQERDLRHASGKLEAWIQDCPVLTQHLQDMSRTQLLLSYAYDHVRLILYSPFVHYIVTDSHSASLGHHYATKAVDAAFHAVEIAELLQERAQLSEAYFLTVDVLAFAAIVLLVLEVGGRDELLVAKATSAGSRAKALFLALSFHNSTAAACWEALMARSETPAGPASTIAQSLHGPRSNELCAPPPKRPSMYTGDSGVEVNLAGYDIGSVNPTLSERHPLDVGYPARSLIPVSCQPERYPGPALIQDMDPMD